MIPVPFFQDGHGELHNGDSVKLLPWLKCEDTICTDPPYGTEVEADGYGRRQNYGGVGRKIAGDSDLRAFAAVMAMTDCTKAAVFASPKREHEVALLLELIGWEVVHQAIWDKNIPGLGGGIRYQHEAILFATRCKWSGACGMESVLRVTSDSRGGIHPHAKPVALMGRILDYCGAKHVIDPFAGTGATLIAAKARGIRYTGIELELDYCEHAKKQLAQEELFATVTPEPQPELTL